VLPSKATARIASIDGFAPFCGSASVRVIDSERADKSALAAINRALRFTRKDGEFLLSDH